MIGDRRVLCLLLPVFGKERAGLGPIHGGSGAAGSKVGILKQRTFRN